MANDLVTRLLLNSSNFENNLANSTRLIQTFQNQVGRVRGGLSSLGGSLTKLVPQLAALGLGIETVNKAINSSETITDTWGATMEAASVSVDGLFNSIANGNFTNFINGLNEVIDTAKEAYDAIDALDTLSAFQDTDLQKLQTERLEVQLEIKQRKKKGEDYTDLTNELLGLDSKIAEMAGEKAGVAAKAYTSSLKEALVKAGIKWDSTVSDLVGKFADTWDDGNGGGFKNIDVAISKAKEDLDKLDKLEERNGHKYKTKQKAEYDVQITKGEITTEAAKEYEFAKKNYETLKVIKNQESSIREAKKYQNVEQQALQSSLQTQMNSMEYIEESTKKTTNSLKVQKEVVSDIAEKAKEFRDIISNGINLEVVGGSSTNIFDDDELVNTLKSLPDKIAAELDAPFKEFIKNQQELNDKYNDGLIDSDTYNSQTINNQMRLYEGISKISNSAVLTQEKSALKETVKPVLDSIKNNIIFNRGKVNDDKYMASVLKLSRQNQKSLSKGSASWTIDIQSEDSNTFEKLRTNIEAGEKLLQAYKEQQRELIEAAIAVAEGTDMGDYVSQMEHLTNTIGVLTTNLDGLKEKFKEVKDSMDMADAISSFASMGNSISSVFKAAGQDEVAFATQALSQIGELIAQLANMAIVAGVSSAAKLPFPYNIAAIATSVATISTIISSAMQTFTNGGVVNGGSYSGDSTVVRVNAGEMILNQSQLANLFRMLNDGTQTKSNGLSGDVSFRIQGRDLVGVLNNYNNKMSKLK